MTNKEDEMIHGVAIEGCLGAFSYQRPAISITERIGDKEVIREFATSDDYKAWKELQGG